MDQHTVKMIVSALQFIMILCILIIVGQIAVHDKSFSSFANPTDSQYNNRYVAANVTVDSQQSLNDRMVAAQRAAQVNTSSMTGSRDPPIFWGGYDSDMNMVNGNVYNARESSVETASGFANKGACNIPGVKDC